MREVYGRLKAKTTRSRRTAISLWLTLLLVVGTVSAAWDRGSGGQSVLGAQVETVGSYATSDPLLGPVRGSTNQILSHAQRFGSQRMADLELYVAEVYRLAPLVGLDPAVVVAQSHLETDAWRTAYWVDNLNPAGIGITASGVPSFTWMNGTDAARGQIVHLFVYAVGPVPAGHVLEPFTPLDPRYDAAIAAGYAGIARTVGDLTGRWAVDPDYGEKLAGRGNEIFVKLRIGGSAQSTGSSAAFLAEDGKATTAWATTTTPPPTPSFAWFDLGGTVSFGSIRWVFAETGLADQYDIQVSNDLAVWTTLGTFTNAPVGAWQNLELGATGRYLRFLFRNPNGDTKLGGLGEIQLWPPTSAPLPWLPAATPPTPWTPGAGVTPTPIPAGPLALMLSADRGTVNTVLGVTLTGFTPGQAVEVRWKGTTRTTATANAFGSAYATFAIPATPIGTHAVEATGGSRTASAPFTIAPRIKVSPGQGQRGATVGVSLRGFGKKETVRIRWRRERGFSEIRTVLTSNTGSANITIAVPSWAAAGATAIRGDGPVARAQTNAFVVLDGTVSGAEEGTLGASPAASPAADMPAVAATETPAIAASPVSASVADDPAVTPTVVTGLPPETPAVIETPTPESTATATPSPEPTPDGTPTAEPAATGTP